MNEKPESENKQFSVQGDKNIIFKPEGDVVFNDSVNFNLGDTYNNSAPDSPIQNSENSSKVGARIFLSYRRASSKDFTARLRDHLLPYIDGDVFMDINSLDAGRYDQKLLAKILLCNVFVLVIGQNTFDPKRIFQDDDWVRQEIREALQKSRRIIPVLHNNASMPKESELPAELHELTMYNALTVFDSDEHFKVGVKTLINWIRNR